MKQNFKNNIFFIPLFFVLICSSSFSQNNNTHRYKKEVKSFFQYAMDSIFKKEKVMIIDSFLCNKTMFNGTPLIIYTSEYSKNPLFTNSEINDIAAIVKTDTTKYFINNKVVPKIKFADEKNKAEWKLSKPIFFRKYQSCVFSFTSIIADTQNTSLYKKVKNKWTFVKIVGHIDNY